MWSLFDEGKLVGLYHYYDEARVVRKNLLSFVNTPLSSVISEVNTLEVLKNHLDYYKTIREFLFV